MRNRFRNRNQVLCGRCVCCLPFGVAYRCFTEGLLVPGVSLTPAIAAFHGRQISLPVTLVCRLQGVAAVQIDNEHKVCQRVSEHDRQKVMRQLKQTA